MTLIYFLIKTTLMWKLPCFSSWIFFSPHIKTRKIKKKPYWAR